MNRTLLRVYDKNDEYSLKGFKDFILIPLDFDWNDYDEREWMLSKISSMGWQNYTSYMIGSIELTTDDNQYWCEILGGDYKEINVEVSRVTIDKKYKLPWMVNI